ncbi:MAG: RHS repeat domain-containing protein [Pseudomonadota bacterium]
MKNIILITMFVCHVLVFYSSAGAGGAYYEYDANGRLVQCSYTNQAMERYSYDAVGNIISIVSYQVSGFVDSDVDGIDDTWELFYFKSLQTADDKTDYDKDGYTDLEEYLLWMEGTLDDNGLSFNPLIFNRGEKNPASILLLIVPILTAVQGAK